MSDCVRFKGHIRKQDGYGIVNRSRQGKSRIFMAHRWVWAEANGKDPWLVPHWVRIKQTCGDHACVNPEHLSAEGLNGIAMSQIPDAGASTFQPESWRSKHRSAAALLQSEKTVCTEGHPFRTDPGEGCIPCKIQRSQDVRYQITT